MYEVAYFTGLRKAGMREKIIATRGLATRYGLSVSCGSTRDLAIRGQTRSTAV